MSSFIQQLGKQALATLTKGDVKGRIYKHYKGGLYKIIGVATNATDGCGRSGKWVTYETLKTTDAAANPIGTWWCRDARQFCEAITDSDGETKLRFVKMPKRYKVKQDDTL